MITILKKLSVKWAVVGLTILLLLTGCSSVTNSANTSNSTDKSSASNGQSQDSSNNNLPTTSSKDSENSSKDSSTKSMDSAKVLLSNLMKSAKEGKVINCDYAANESVNIYDIQSKFGKADKSEEWVPAAKGFYTTYSKYNLVFGSNKGGSVFEIRSIDNSLKEVSLSNVKDVFGKPDYDVKTNGQEIIGYTTGTDYKILLVFPEPLKDSDDPKLDHYSVLYPKGTVNSMAGDSGRQW